MKLFVFLFAYFSLSGVLIYARMPNGTYSDYYARYKVIAMTYFYDIPLFKNGSLNMTDFMKGCYNSSEWLTLVTQPCAMYSQDTTVNCTGGVAVIHDEEAIMITFRGTVGGQELDEEMYGYNTTVQFPGGGTVAKFFYNGFLTIWNAGIRDVFFAAKNKYPTYELWVVGTSMGGSLAGDAAAYISQMGYIDKNNLKLLTFGQLRTGKDDFAARYADLVPYAYRITHRHDIVPHLVPIEAGYSHYGKEIWYPTDMGVNATYIECDTIESTNCSDSIQKANWTWGDHFYFNNYLCPPYIYTTGF